MTSVVQNYEWEGLYYDQKTRCLCEKPQKSWEIDGVFQMPWVNVLPIQRILGKANSVFVCLTEPTTQNSEVRRPKGGVPM